jgi:TfoX/Sxy family transcriptional regulator of competence genes
MIREEKVELYNRMVATHPEAILKGDTIPYTSLNGHMYSFLSKGDEVTLKLPADERLKFIEKYNTRLAENYGIVQKEYVVVPDSLLQNTDELKQYFEISYQYIASLKPKPTTKGKKKD